MAENEMEIQIAALAEFVFEMYARQMAILSLLRESNGFSPAILDREMDKATRQVQRMPGFRELRSKRDLAKLLDIMTNLRTI